MRYYRLFVIIRSPNIQWFSIRYTKPTQIRLKKIIKELAEDKNTTVLVSSHDLQHTIEVSDRILVLQKGEIVKDILPSAETLKELETFFSE